MRELAKSRAQVFIYLIFISSVTVKVRFKVRVSCRVRVRFNNFHMLRKFRAASHLAMRHIWHDIGLKGAVTDHSAVPSLFISCNSRCYSRSLESIVRLHNSKWCILQLMLRNLWYKSFFYT